MATSKSKSAIKHSAADKKFAIIVSRYHEELTEKLLDGAVETLESMGAKKEDIVTTWVPGAFEIPLTARALAQREFDAILCLGIVLKGETTHDEYIATEVARGISQIALSSGIPVVFGVLTTQTLDQAKERCGGSHGHKGIEAAETAVQMIHTLEHIKELPSKNSKGVGF